MAKKRRTLAESRAAQAKKASTTAGREYVEGAPRGRKKTAKKKKAPNRTKGGQLNIRIDLELLEALRATCKRREKKREHPWRIGDAVEQAVLQWLQRVDKRRGPRDDPKKTAQAIINLAERINATLLDEDL